MLQALLECQSDPKTADALIKQAKKHHAKSLAR
jgi:hypothetical protein